MIISRELISNGISTSLLAKLIYRHEQTKVRYEKLRDYYVGRHDILSRKIASEGLANNKVVCNHAKYMVDTTVSYLVGNPISYAVSDGYDIEALKNIYLEQDIQRVDYRLEKYMSIYGRAYELIYADESSKPKSAILSPMQAFVVYDDSCTQTPLFGVYYYKQYNLDGGVDGVVCNVFDEAFSYAYSSSTDSWDVMELTEKNRHYFGGVPLIEYINNDEKQGDFEQVIPLIDAYNKLQSDRVNDKENFVDCLLFLIGIDIDSEQARKLKEEKILMGYEGADAKYLSKILSESDMKVLRDDLKEDIHRLSLTPDLSDESFGNNLSGVAIKYKIMSFENHIKDKEGYFRTGLKQRFILYMNFLALKGACEWVPIHRVDIVFNHNLPANDLETSQMINNLSGKVTNETLIGQLGFVADAKEEAELAKKEAEEKADAAAQRSAMSWAPQARNER